MNSKRLGQQLMHIIDGVIKGGAYVAITVLIAMMLLTVVGVVLRYAFNKPITGDIEIIQSMMITVAFLSIAYCALKDGNVSMDYFAERLPPRGRVAVEMIGYLLCLTVIAPMTWLNLPEALDNLKIGISSTVLGIPAYPFYLIISISCLMLSCVLLVNLVKSAVRLVK